MDHLAATLYGVFISIRLNVKYLLGKLKRILFTFVENLFLRWDSNPLMSESHLNLDDYEQRNFLMVTKKLEKHI